MDGILLSEHVSVSVIGPGLPVIKSLCFRLNMALELAKNNPVYEDIASKFFEASYFPRPHPKCYRTNFAPQHFIFIADAMTFPVGEDRLSLWNEQDGMYYDAIHWGGHSMQLPVRSLVGLIPLYATLTLEPSVVNRLPGFKKRMNWFLENRPDVSGRNMANMKGLFLFRSAILIIQRNMQLVAVASASYSRLPARSV